MRCDRGGLSGVAAVAVLVGMVALFGWMPAGDASEKSGAGKLPAGMGTHASGPVATVTIEKQPELFAADPPPLTVTQCGQCHPSAFQDIKKDGGRHTFTCQGCHKSFHSFNPRKNNWDEIMPKCADCHSTPSVPHVQVFTQCSECHTNPHSIARLPMTKKLTDSCAVCHAGPPAELKQYPSKHTSLACAACHTGHGVIPSCNMCHKPHYEGQEFKTCASECHPVHKPKQVTYAKDVGARTCGACHGKVYAAWTGTPSRHGTVNCAVCHSRHGYIPQCGECHGLPHSKQLHDRFPKCLTCHQDAHNPPVRQR
ncbi:cytochrome C [Geobacter anodireducens]|uniref:Cytochrome C n=1 Tax=Geobacter anodireducens TaxID=1340425 RepID=A0ABR9NV07_9BACT|nr:cytochrome C [Geobacter anodireducens]MBE2888102.1 cytochrome C [Geobacter anodireducens]